MSKIEGSGAKGGKLIAVIGDEVRFKTHPKYLIVPRLYSVRGLVR